MPCLRCGARKFWTLKNERRRCVRCRYDLKPDRLPLRLTRRQWRGLLEWFVRGMTSAQIAQETLDYGAIVYRSRLYRLPTAGDGRASAPFGYLEGFWTYLHQRLRAAYDGGVSGYILPSTRGATTTER
jgi:hypothetical protein